MSRKWFFGSLASAAAVLPVLAQTNVTFPAYGAGQVQGAPPEAQAAGGADAFKGMAADIAAIRKLLEDAAGEKPAPGVEPTGDKGAAPKPPADLQSAANKCAACHLSSVAAAKGGDFALFDAKTGRVSQLADRDRSRVVAKVKAGSMPPPGAGTLTDGEKAALVALFSAEPPKK